MRALACLAVLALAGCQPHTPAAESPQDWWIAFNSMRSGDGDIYAIHPETRQLREVVVSPAPEGGVRYDAARDRVVFHRFDSEETPILNTLDAVLFADPEGGVPLQWSPDGHTVAYTQIIDDVRTLFLANTDLSDARPVPNGGASDNYPIFSPNADRLAFVRRLEGGSDIHILNLQTRQIERVTRLEAYIGHPGWSPDGTRLVFDTFVGEEVEIATVDIATGEVAVVAERPGYDLNPTWSPDGRLIAWAGGSEEGFDIYAVELATGEIRKLTEHPANDAGPAFIPASALRFQD